jgi:hypothetical protein
VPHVELTPNGRGAYEDGTCTHRKAESSLEFGILLHLGNSIREASWGGMICKCSLSSSPQSITLAIHTDASGSNQMR